MDTTCVLKLSIHFSGVAKANHHHHYHQQQQQQQTNRTMVEKGEKQILQERLDQEMRPQHQASKQHPGGISKKPKLDKYPEDERRRVMDLAGKMYYRTFNFMESWADKSPRALEAWMLMDRKLFESQLFTEKEQHLIQAVISVHNHCIYCMNCQCYHGEKSGIEHDDAQEVFRGGLPKDRRLRQLAQATRLVLSRKSNLSKEDRELIHGKWNVTEEQLVEICSFIGLMYAANYVNMVLHPETEEKMKIFQS